MYLCIVGQLVLRPIAAFLMELRARKSQKIEIFGRGNLPYGRSPSSGLSCEMALAISLVKPDLS